MCEWDATDVWLAILCFCDGQCLSMMIALAPSKKLLHLNNSHQLRILLFLFLMIFCCVRWCLGSQHCRYNACSFVWYIREGRIRTYYLSNKYVYTMHLNMIFFCCVDSFIVFVFAFDFLIVSAVIISWDSFIFFSRGSKHTFSCLSYSFSRSGSLCSCRCFCLLIRIRYDSREFGSTTVAIVCLIPPSVYYYS